MCIVTSMWGKSTVSAIFSGVLGAVAGQRIAKQADKRPIARRFCAKPKICRMSLHLDPSAKRNLRAGSSSHVGNLAAERDGHAASGRPSTSGNLRTLSSVTISTSDIVTPMTAPPSPSRSCRCLRRRSTSSSRSPRAIATVTRSSRTSRRAPAARSRWGRALSIAPSSACSSRT